MTTGTRTEYRQFIVDQIEPTERSIRTMRDQLIAMDQRGNLDETDRAIYALTAEGIASQEVALAQMRKWEAASV